MGRKNLQCKAQSICKVKNLNQFQEESLKDIFDSFWPNNVAKMSDFKQVFTTHPNCSYLRNSKQLTNHTIKNKKILVIEIVANKQISEYAELYLNKIFVKWQHSIQPFSQCTHVAIVLGVDKSSLTCFTAVQMKYNCNIIPLVESNSFDI